MKVHMMLRLIRTNTGSSLKIKIYEPLDNEEIAALVNQLYKGWRLVEVLNR